MGEKKKGDAQINAAVCTNCGTIVVSKHVHDFQSCSCYKDSVESEDVTGFFLDGGDEYRRYGGNIKHIKWITR